MSNLQTHCYFKLDFQKVNQHTGGKYLINGTKHHKAITPCRINPIYNDIPPTYKPLLFSSLIYPMFHVYTPVKK